MMKLNVRILILALAVIVILGVVSFGQRGPGPKGDWGFRGPEMMEPGSGPGPLFRALRHLDLTEEQRSEIRNLMEANREQVQVLRDELFANREAIQAAASPDDLGALPEEYGRIVADMTRAGALLRMEIVNNILTEDQRQQLEQIREERQHRRGQRGD